MVDGRLYAPRSAVARLQLPRILPLIMDQPGIIIPLVEIFEDGGEDLGLLVGEVDLLALGFHELPPAGRLEERREAEDVFVGSEEALLSPDDEGNYRRGQGARNRHQRPWEICNARRWIQSLTFREEGLLRSAACEDGRGGSWTLHAP